MTRKRVTVRIAPNGTISAETAGFTGDACLAMIPRLEDLLGAATIDSQFTAEFHGTETTKSLSEIARVDAQAQGRE